MADDNLLPSDEKNIIKSGLIQAPDSAPVDHQEEKIHPDTPTISEILSFFLNRNSFYAAVLARLPVHTTIKIPSVMGVGIVDGQYILMYNPLFMQKWVQPMLPINRIQFLDAVIAHEATHILLKHIPRLIQFSLSLSSERQRALFLPLMNGYTVLNVASDAAANQLLQEEYESIKGHILSSASMSDEENRKKEFGWILPSTFDLPSEFTAEQFAESLLKNVKTPPSNGEDMLKEVREAINNRNGNPGDKENGKQKSKGSGQQGEGKSDGEGQPSQSGRGGRDKTHLGSHGDWADYLENADTQELEKLAQELEASSNKLLDDAMSCTRGTIPGSLQEALGKINKPTNVPWNRVLRNLIVARISANKIRSLARSKRRACPGACIYPGHTLEPTFEIVYGIDMSGSMSPNAITRGFNELEHICKQFPGIRATIVEFDAAIQRVYTIDKSQDIVYEAVGRGGTSFDPFFEFVKEHGAKIAVIFTDGFAPAPETRPRIPVVWCLTESGECPCPEYGKQVRVNED